MGTKKDSITFEYARMIFTGSLNQKIKVFYEDGTMEELHEKLNFKDSIFSNSDSTASAVFFKINCYLISKGFELVSSSTPNNIPEYIYKKEKNNFRPKTKIKKYLLSNSFYQTP